MIENGGIELPQHDWDCDHNVFTSCLCFIFSFLLPHGKVKKKNMLACEKEEAELHKPLRKGQGSGIL